MVQWLGCSALTAQSPGLIPGWGIKILQAMQCGQEKLKKTLKRKTMLHFLKGLLYIVGTQIQVNDLIIISKLYI